MNVRLVPTSEYRTMLPADEYIKENWYGLLLTEEGRPVICNHGGSMWLCGSCAIAALAADS